MIDGQKTTCCSPIQPAFYWCKKGNFRSHWKKTSGMEFASNLTFETYQHRRGYHMTDINSSIATKLGTKYYCLLFKRLGLIVIW